MKRTVLKLTVPAAALLLMSACTSDPNSPGVEYMPDMYRSPSIEAYVDYQNPDQISARVPATGTIPFYSNPIEKINAMPYAYPNTAEGYEAAGAELKNPLPLTQEILDQGKELYTKFCIHCHGPEGNGDGTMVTNDKFPPPPVYSGIQGLSTGKIFHSITYGKGLMGPHAPLLSKVERWKVTHYVEQLVKGNTSGKLAADSTAAAVSDTAATAAAQGAPKTK